jgi:hypothetical protein
MSNKVTLRSYGYFLHFLHSIFGEKWFLQLCPKLPGIVQKSQGILGIKQALKVYSGQIQYIHATLPIKVETTISIKISNG